MKQKEKTMVVRTKMQALKNTVWGACKQVTSRLWARTRSTAGWLWKHAKREVVCYSVLACFILTLFGGFALHGEVVYQTGVDLFEKGQYEAAAECFERTADLKNAGEYLSLCRQSLVYQQADALMAGGDYESAQEMYLSLGEFKDAEMRADWCDTLSNAPEVNQQLKATTGQLSAMLNAAQRKFAAGEYLEAYTAFKALGEYEDAASKASRSLQRHYEEQNITQLDFSHPENRAYKKDRPSFQFFEGATEVTKVKVEEDAEGYRIPDGRVLFTDYATGNLYLLTESGQETLLLAGYRSAGVGLGDDFEQETVYFDGMIDEHRFVYTIGGFFYQYGMGVYDLSSGMDYRIDAEMEPWSYWYPQKVVGDQLYFAGCMDYSPGVGMKKIGKLDLNSYAFSKTELTSFGFEVGGVYPGNTYYITDFDVSPDENNIVFVGDKDGRAQVLLCSLREQKVIQTGTIVYEPLNEYYDVVYGADGQVYFYILPIWLSANNLGTLFLMDVNAV